MSVESVSLPRGQRRTLSKPNTILVTCHPLHRRTFASLHESMLSRPLQVTPLPNPIPAQQVCVLRHGSRRIHIKRTPTNPLPWPKPFANSAKPVTPNLLSFATRTAVLTEIHTDRPTLRPGCATTLKARTNLSNRSNYSAPANTDIDESTTTNCRQHVPLPSLLRSCLNQPPLQSPFQVRPTDQDTPNQPGQAC